jgi:redox-sensitive bicupin YhaK (pirin superfamily)
MAATIARGQTLTQPLATGRAAYLVLAKGAATVNGAALHERDGVGIAREEAVTITATEDAEVVMVEVAEE